MEQVVAYVVLFLPIVALLVCVLLWARRNGI
jgi:hypothetical protein